MLQAIFLAVSLVAAATAELQEGEGSGLQQLGGTASGDGVVSASVVELVVMLPGSSRARDAVWDRGEAILPAAQLAVEEINADPDILPDCTLKLLPVDIESCVEDQFTSNVQALVAFANISSSTDPNRHVLGIIGGPFCPPLLVKLISPLASTNESRLFQMFGSTSPQTRNGNPKANFITPSSTLYYKTVYEMMRVFNWTKLLIIAENFFDESTSAAETRGLNVTLRQFFSSSPSSLPSLFKDIRKSERNIILVSVGTEDAAAILCQAKQEALVHPDYVWIFYDLTSDIVLNSEGNSCFLKATDLNGIFFLQFPLKPFSENIELVSGHTYSEYYSIYTSRLAADAQPNPYANVLYDSVWSFAATLDTILASKNTSLDNYLSTHSKQSLIDLMDQSLSDVVFEGASGSLDFSKDPASDGVKIYLHSNNNLMEVGTYQNSSNISILESVVASVPKDTLSTVYALVPVPVTAILVTLMVICLVMTTIILSLFIYYRDHPDVKATSPYLSYLMFLGCYLLFFSTLTHAVSGVTVIHGLGRLIECWAVIGLDSLGVNLIFTTLLLRMLRIYRVFSSFHRTGKLWTNKNMIGIVGLVVLLEVTFVLVWSLVDTFRILDITVYLSAAKPPHYEITQICQSNYLEVWLGILLGKVGLLFAIVLVLAVKTRKIRKSNFKDTKKVNGYIFSTVMIVITMMSLYFLFRSTENHVAAHLMVYLAFGITGFLCQLFLFVPKVTAPLLKRYGYEIMYDNKKKRKTLIKSKSKPSVSRAATLIMKDQEFTNII